MTDQRDPGTEPRAGDRTSHGMPSPKRRVGPYEIVRQIGRGGMATVYLARQVTLDRNVALKELSSFHASSPEFAERFLRESRLAGSLNHPNVVTVLEYFEEGGTPFIAMEYVRGGSLRPYVGRLGLAQFAGVMEGVLAGLTHAEQIGVVHRDLKPENLMVTSDGRVKIADFGIAKATQSAGTGAFLTATGTTVGTPTYMAPEQAMAGDVGPWTDLYSVGVMAWEHIVGHVPFHDTDAPMVILMRQVNERIPSAVEVNPDTDRELSDWIDRLLVKDPHGRTQNALEAWEQLEEIVIGLLGPRWRRDARLPEHVSTLDTPRALTPAPFSVKTPTPPPGSMPQPAADASGAAPPAPEPEYMTFGAPAPAAPEAPPAATPAVAAASGAVAAGAVAAVAASAVETPADVPAAPEAPAPPQPAAPEQDNGYMTFGPAQAATPEASVAAPEVAAPQAPAPPAPAEPDAPAPAPAVTPPEPRAETTPTPGAEAILAAATGSETIAPERVAAPEVAPVAPVTKTPGPQEPEAPRAETVPEAEPVAIGTPEPPAPEPPAPVPPAPARATRAREPRPARSQTARRLAGLALVAGIIAAVLGFVVAPAKTKAPAAAGPPLVGSASAGPLSVSFPAGWSHAAATPVAHLPLSNQLTVTAAAPDAGTLVMGTTSTSDASLLPASFLSALSSPPSPQVVRLGTAQFYRYLDVTPAGASGPETVYALPTSVGSVVAVCQAGSGSAGFPATCERVVSTLQVSGTVLGLGPDTGYAASLSAVMSTLSGARNSAQAQLTAAKTPSAQATAANAVATAYDHAAGAVGKLTPGPSAQSANGALAAALHALAAGYTALARAASHNDQGAYGRAQSAISAATSQLSAGFAALSKLGYTIG